MQRQRQRHSVPQNARSSSERGPSTLPMSRLTIFPRIASGTSWIDAAPAAGADSSTLLKWHSLRLAPAPSMCKYRWTFSVCGRKAFCVAALRSPAHTRSRLLAFLPSLASQRALDRLDPGSPRRWSTDRRTRMKPVNRTVLLRMGWDKLES